VAALERFSEQSRPFRGAEMLPQNSAAEAELGDPQRIVRLIEPARNDHLRDPGPDRLSRRSDTAVMDQRGAAGKKRRKVYEVAACDLRIASIRLRHGLAQEYAGHAQQTAYRSRLGEKGRRIRDACAGRENQRPVAGGQELAKVRIQRRRAAEYKTDRNDIARPVRLRHCEPFRT